MGKLSRVAIDSERESEGVWVDYEAGIKLKIARMNNPDYERRMKRRSKFFQVKYRRGQTPDPEELNPLINDAMAHHILVDWKDVEDDDGKPLPYSPAKALEIFEDPKYADFRSFVLQVSQEQELFRKEEVEDAAGNLPSASSGN